MEQEIKETIFIAISAILLASLLGFVAYLMNVRSEFATVRNAEVQTTDSMSNFREFNNYNGLTLYGEDVVAAVRDYYDSGLRLRVNDSSLPSGYYSIDKYDARNSPEKIEIPYLQSIFPTEKKYKAVLVYGSVDLATVTKNYVPPSAMDTNVSSIVFFYDGVR